MALPPGRCRRGTGIDRALRARARVAAPRRPRPRRAGGGGRRAGAGAPSGAAAPPSTSRGRRLRWIMRREAAFAGARSPNPRCQLFPHARMHARALPPAPPPSPVTANPPPPRARVRLPVSLPLPPSLSHEFAPFPLPLLLVPARSISLFPPPRPPRPLRLPLSSGPGLCAYRDLNLLISPCDFYSNLDVTFFDSCPHLSLPDLWPSRQAAAAADRGSTAPSAAKRPSQVREAPTRAACSSRMPACTRERSRLHRHPLPPPLPPPLSLCIPCPPSPSTSLCLTLPPSLSLPPSSSLHRLRSPTAINPRPGRPPPRPGADPSSATCS
jgi:hypothetical protein